MKLLRTLLCSLLPAGLLFGCSQTKNVSIDGDAVSKPQSYSTGQTESHSLRPSEKEGRSITERSIKFDEPLPPIEDFSVRDTILHSMHQKNPRLDLQNLRYYNRKVKRGDLLALQGSEASHITNLVIKDLQLDDADIEPISKMKLQKLNLSYNPVRDLHAIRNMNSLVELTLDYSQVNRDGLKVAATLPNLTALRVSGTTIFDADLPLLYSLKRLEELGLSECKNVSPAGVAKIRQVLPGCTVQTISPVKGFHETGVSDLKTVEEGLMRQKEYGEADLALQKFISNWKNQKTPPAALLAEAYRLRGECQKALGNSSASKQMFAESSRIGSRSKDLKNHRE